MQGRLFYFLDLLPPGEEVLLIVDRTDFKIRGSTWVNLLVLGIEWHGVFIPLMWTDLGRRGNSDQQQRTALPDRLLGWWRHSGRELPVFCLTANREFTGLVRFEQENLREKEPYVLLLTNLDKPSGARQIYRRPRPIESCFGHQKKRGYDLETAQLEGTYRLDILFAAVTLAYALSIKEGVEKDHTRQVKSRRFPKGKTYRRISLFAYVYRLLKTAVHRPAELMDRLLLRSNGQSPSIILE